jgi:hypothetical protein
MNPTTTLVTGLATTAVVLVSWLGGVYYLRRLRPPAPQPVERPETIEDWIARVGSLPEGKRPGLGGRDQGRLRELAARHFPYLAEPHPRLHLIGVTGVEKRLVTWVCEQTRLPDPFDALERLTGDPDEIRRACEVWKDAHDSTVAVIDRLCVASAALHENWTGPRAEKFFAILSEYLTELDALAADVQATEATLRGLQAETALAEGTIVGLVNLLVGSLGGYVVEAVVTAGTMAPAVAAQAQLEVVWVLKQIARALDKLPGAYVNARHVLQSVHGFKGLAQMREHFQIDEVRTIERSLDSTV